MNNTDLRQRYRRWPAVREEHRQAVLEVVDSGRWHYGDQGSRLERDLSAYLGVPCAAVASCAWALYLAVRALPNVRTVGVPVFTYHGSVHPVLWAGCTPVFIDIDPRTYTICPDAVSRTLKRQRLDAIIAVHLHGLPFNKDLAGLCQEAGTWLIEDACQAFGARIGSKLVGTIGDAAAFSFNSRKNLPAGLGGAVAFRSDDLTRRAQQLREYGDKNDHGEPVEIGSYLPIGEFDAALARVQLAYVDEWNVEAGRFANVLRGVLGNRMPDVPDGYTHVWHKVRIRGTEDERQALEQAGVITSKWVERPLVDYPAYSEWIVNASAFPGAASALKDSFYLFDDIHPLAAQDADFIETLANRILEVIG